MAEPGDDFGFDIYVEDKNVIVWVDLAQLVGQEQIDQLRDGANLGFELTFRLDLPRRLFGDQTAVLNVQSVAISYNLITETFSASFSEDEFERQVSFFKTSDFREYLADSLSFQIAPYEDLEADQQYVLKIKVLRLSMSEPPETGDSQVESESSSLLKSVFRQFLDLTAFGRQEFSAESRALSASELTD